MLDSSTVCEVAHIKIISRFDFYFAHQKFHKCSPVLAWVRVTVCIGHSVHCSHSVFNGRLLNCAWLFAYVFYVWRYFSHAMEMPTRSEEEEKNVTKNVSRPKMSNAIPSTYSYDWCRCVCHIIIDLGWRLFTFVYHMSATPIFFALFFLFFRNKYECI